jgi:glycosyltransferase involved in cell wall biosynthesis
MVRKQFFDADLKKTGRIFTLSECIIKKCLNLVKEAKRVGTYSVIVTCRNSERDIRSALASLINQTVRPKYVLVVDDGSSDLTPKILNDISSNHDNIFITTNPDLGYDIGRVVGNWNKALRLAKDLGLESTNYHMISTDDTVYEKDYCEKIINRMDLDSSIAIASGTYGNYSSTTPHGAGRFVSNSFFFSILGSYPQKMGYESAILYLALANGFRYTVIPEARFVHTRLLGSSHHFYEFGASMRTLGYHPIFVMGRFFKYFLSGTPIGRLGSLYMLYHYLFYKPKSQGYDSMYDLEFRKSIRAIQVTRIRRYIRLGVSK